MTRREKKMRKSRTRHLYYNNEIYRNIYNAKLVQYYPIEKCKLITGHRHRCTIEHSQVFEVMIQYKECNYSVWLLPNGVTLLGNILQYSHRFQKNYQGQRGISKLYISYRRVTYYHQCSMSALLLVVILYDTFKLGVIQLFFG